MGAGMVAGAIAVSAKQQMVERSYRASPIRDADKAREILVMTWN